MVGLELLVWENHIWIMWGKLILTIPLFEFQLICCMIVEVWLYNTFYMLIANIFEIRCMNFNVGYMWIFGKIVCHVMYCWIWMSNGIMNLMMLIRINDYQLWSSCNLYDLYETWDAFLVWIALPNFKIILSTLCRLIGWVLFSLDHY